MLWFSVILNVNLAMLNLLPLPVLDGGHITLSLIEVVRRRPVSAKILNAIQTGFAVLLIGFMLLHRVFRHRRLDPQRAGRPRSSRSFLRRSK